MVVDVQSATRPRIARKHSHCSDHHRLSISTDEISSIAYSNKSVGQVHYNVDYRERIENLSGEQYRCPYIQLALIDQNNQLFAGPDT